jgi:hypothetical protein
MEAAPTSHSQLAVACPHACQYGGSQGRRRRRSLQWLLWREGRLDKRRIRWRACEREHERETQTQEREKGGHE